MKPLSSSFLRICVSLLSEFIKSFWFESWDLKQSYAPKKEKKSHICIIIKEILMFLNTCLNDKGWRYIVRQAHWIWLGMGDSLDVYPKYGSYSLRMGKTNVCQGDLTDLRNTTFHSINMNMCDEGICTWEREILSLSAFLGTEDIAVHIVHKSRLIITYTLE